MSECDPTSPASIPVWLVAARAVHFGACLLLFGLPAFDRLFAREGSWPRDTWRRVAWPASTRWLLGLALAAAWLSGAAWLVFVASEMCECTPAGAIQTGVLKVVWGQTHFGRLWQLRSALWLVTAVLLLPALLPGRSSRLRPVLIWAALLPAGGLLGSLAWAGHGINGTGPAAPAHLPADMVHLLVSGVWPTGLLPFGLLLLRLRAGAGAQHWRAVAQLTRRFSAVSLASVLLVTVTGVINSWLLVGSLPALTGTPYGRLLVGKITLFVGMLGLGAVNLLLLRPRLSAAATAATAGSAPAAAVAGHLRYNVAVEFALGALVVLVVALLGVLPPAAG